MTLRVFNLSRVAPLLMLAAGLGASSPAAACGYSYGCYAPSPVIVQPYYQSCSCCGCGGAGYAGYAYAAPYYGAYAAGYGYDESVLAGPGYYPHRWRPRHYWGPRRWW
jgi:hypothetical protein